MIGRRAAGAQFTGMRRRGSFFHPDLHDNAARPPHDSNTNIPVAYAWKNAAATNTFRNFPHIAPEQIKVEGFARLNC
ncbi:hypothetical protein AOE01nite_10620 [Acetobacter oeni]|uniref:Uncharacterized protein n=1 Tax=Acetobacter oeni TaxID=304077 RepID=A0A511XIQ6_9PROT|nr:hypothetical protein AOE01nite_10620 [Acetobacter oeni]